MRLLKYIKLLLWLTFTKEGLELQRKNMIQENCKHEKWNCDNQIRTIECKDCGKRAWIEDYKDLYNKKNINI